MVLDTIQRKREQRLLLAFTGVVIITIGVLYFGIFRGARSGVPATVLEKKELEALSTPILTVRIPQDLFEKQAFLQLGEYKPLSRDIPSGRGNPFLPGF